MPAAAPRDPVDVNPDTRTRVTPPAPRPSRTVEPEAATDAPPPPAATTENEAKTAPLSRGVKRAQLLRKLEGGDVVLLEPDPAHPPSMTEPLELAEAVAFSLQNNYGAKVAQAKKEGSRWEYIGGIGQYLPRVDIERQDGSQRSSPAAYHYANTSSASTNLLASENRHDMWSRSITVRQPLVDLTIITDILNREKSYKSVSADETATREGLALDTINSYFRLAQSRMTIKFATTFKSNLDNLAQRMKDRVAGGGASAVELDRITGRSVSAQSTIIEASAEYQAAMAEFRRLTGVTPIKLSLPADLLPALPDSVDEVLAGTMQNNPEYMAALLRADASEYAAAKPFANLLPKLSLQISDSKTYNSGGIANENPINMGTPPQPIYPYAKDRRVMLVLNWTLNGGVDLGQGMANAAYARQATFQATDTRQRLEESVRTSYNALNAANGRIDAVSKAVDANSKVAVAFEEQYVNGSRQLLDLLDAYERLYQSQIELSRLLVAESSAGFLLRRQMGQLVDAIMTRDKN